MLFNGHKPLLNRDNTPVLDETSNVVTLGLIAVNALDVGAEGEKLTAEQKLSRHLLQMKLWRSEVPTKITTEEATLIKNAVANHPGYSPLVLGRIFEEIEKE